MESFIFNGTTVTNELVSDSIIHFQIEQTGTNNERKALSKCHLQNSISSDYLDH